MDYTLNSWKEAAATLVVQGLPLQTFDSALSFTDGYVAAAGGWVPDIPGDPTGFGHPANDATPEQGAADIIDQQYGRVYNLSVAANIEVGFNYQTNLLAGQSVDAVLSILENELKDFIQTQLAKSNLRIDSYDGVTAFLTNRGLTTVQDRVLFNSDIINNQKLYDPREIALYNARQANNLDTTWNVYSSFTDFNEPIVVQIKKYTDVSYQTLDTTNHRTYVINVNAESYTLTGGVILDQQS